MSSDEDDYMSNKYLKVGTSHKGLPKCKHVQRQHEMFKKKLKFKLTKKEVKEAADREAGLNSAISQKNKGFIMLAKMGYKPGKSLGARNSGITEPINIVIKSNYFGTQTACEHFDRNGNLSKPIVDFYWSKKEMDKNCGSDEDDNLELIENVISEENLIQLNEYLRLEYFYCIYCAEKGDDLEDLKSFCPGNSVEDHILDY
ncbi:PREDICTED: G patch domain-containing protein 11-like [Nicrophorus vespilloides]|uniref:G patch domain-containing protein 11 n=1 Tax=Nicrophorus vespilloides TaxID=110193 RepID=A0ABM1N455_NICVS|nr:PREDICTED: G patch domain-containing protein 11-like [Nicrophorus vespilloides]